MDRTEKEEYIIGVVSLLANKLSQIGDGFLPDITFKQWFLLIIISKMEKDEKNINDIAELSGTTRQNIKKMLALLEKKEYVVVSKSQKDSRALKVQLTEKAYLYFENNRTLAAKEADNLFKIFANEEIDLLASKLQKLFQSLENYERKDKDE